ncbi:hypothetical protein RRSWK_00942 [Rhodopirellula sp. SWK7]|nr:hypothetical protein RRSWK_00942 [Rhodopirellula sp. SWK7]
MATLVRGNRYNPNRLYFISENLWYRNCDASNETSKQSFMTYASLTITLLQTNFRETVTMFAPINAPIIIQTVHGLTYKVAATSNREDNEDPHLSRKSNRLESKPKSDKDDSRVA